MSLMQVTKARLEPGYSMPLTLIQLMIIVNDIIRDLEGFSKCGMIDELLARSKIDAKIKHRRHL